MLDIAFATVQGHDHLRPLIPYMSEAISRGHLVTLFYGSNSHIIRQEMENEGLGEVKLVRAHKEISGNLHEAKIISKLFYNYAEGGLLAALSSELFTSIVSHYSGKKVPDVLVCDFFATAATDAGDKLRVPVVTVFPNPISLVALPPPNSKSIGQHVQAFLMCNIMEDWFSRFLTKLRNNERRKRDLPRLREQDIYPCLSQQRHMIANTGVGFEYEFERSPLLHFVGPSPPSNPAELKQDLAQWLYKQKLPVLYVAFGTKTEFDKYTIANLVRELLDVSDRVSILWSLSSNQQEILEIFEIPSNWRLENFVHQWSVLANPNIKAFLTHSGSNSTYEAILNEVPMICCPIGKDQPANAERVRASGVGLIVKGGANGPVSTCIKSLLNDISLFEAAAKQLKEILTNLGGATKAVDIIEMIANRGWQEIEEDALSPRKCIF